MTYGTVCSGIEAPSVAWKYLGWEPVFFSEIDKHANTLLNYHYPDVCNLGDIREVRYGGTVDIIAGGTPCQSWSNSGKGKGLADPRGQLVWEFFRIIEETRPDWFLWENVPKVLRTDSNDFGRIIQRVGELRYGWAYRVLDAKYFGSASRRRRLFLIGCNRGANFAGSVLFDGSFKTRNPAAKSPKYPLLDASTYGRKWQSNQWVRNAYALIDQKGIRRATPIEGERMMGFPDNYTKIPGVPESARYGLIGNSISVQVLKWIGERINQVELISKN